VNRNGYATVINQHNHPTRLEVCAWHGTSQVRKTLLNAMLGTHTFEQAREEAQAFYPNRTILVPQLGERPTGDQR
jgi:hypothetical protein